MAPKLQLPQSRMGRSLLGASLLQAVIVVVLEAIVAAIVMPNIDTQNVNDPNRGVPVYMLIFVASQVWNMYLSWDAILKQNTIQLIAFVAFNVCTFAYSLFQFRQVTRQEITNGPLLIVIPVVLGVFTIIFAALAYKLYLEFGWKIYKKIGADPNMKNMFRLYQVFLTLLKVDVFFMMAFSVQYLVLVLRAEDYEFGVTIAAVPLTLFTILVAVYGLRRESKKLMVVFLISLLVGIVYFVFKIVRIWTLNRERLYGTQLFLTFFASLSLAMLVLTLINSVMCYFNFGKGLKTHITTRAQAVPHVSQLAAECTTAMT
ncbi:hypothetical protein AMAG_04117 [Allomyces macrogynus ATCC 38327]|uniref:DUF7789 domain-containing protein n=1 Tax=Allomyces macrogynus (strain ATCC 38327) TaxID=578462 RepID=A0A0L0S7Z5_ALLM3|nr:hypothetical protein AMAG_04117 [Allomyces macrogynus ATCC 38327]|eukprot:KNE58551.1 hypothetical protein AMAG_04117 [Allomyces macrogynus ATCC 38327]